MPERRKIVFRRLSTKELKRESVIAKAKGLSFPEAGLPDILAIKKAFGFEPVPVSEVVDNLTSGLIHQNKAKKLRLNTKNYDYHCDKISSNGDHALHADKN